MSVEARSAVANDYLLDTEAREVPIEKKRPSRLARRLGLDKDRVGPIPGGLAAWLGAAAFWSVLAWVFFG